MKITVITSNKPRHNYLISLLQKVASKMYVIQEVDTIFPGLKDGRYPKGNKFAEYFENVHKSRKKKFLKIKI